MNHEIVTWKWTCPECGGCLRLFFSPGPGDEDGHSDDVDFDDVRCMKGHPVPADLAEEIGDAAQDEFFRAFDKGFQIAEVWLSPKSDDAAPA